MILFKRKESINKYFGEGIHLNRFKNNSNFIQKLISSFHDYDNLYFISKFYEGSIFNYLNNIWSEDQIRFFSACLIQAFTSLRKEKFIHRDVHFNNLVLDEKQYVNLIDLHIAIEYKNKDNPRNNVVGSPKLCAPEMIKGLKYDYNSDYYRLGGMIYFILFRQHPNLIIQKQKSLTNIKIDYNKTKNISFSCIDFINKLIIINPKKRIGFYNIEELKNHDFFKNFTWNDLINGTMISPFPKNKNKTIDLCKTKINVEKDIFISSALLKNKTLKNKLLIFDNINFLIIEKIFKTLTTSDELIL